MGIFGFVSSLVQGASGTSVSDLQNLISEMSKASRQISVRFAIDLGSRLQISSALLLALGDISLAVKNASSPPKEDEEDWKADINVDVSFFAYVDGRKSPPEYSRIYWRRYESEEGPVQLGPNWEISFDARHHSVEQQDEMNNLISDVIGVQLSKNQIPFRVTGRTSQMEMEADWIVSRAAGSFSKKILLEMSPGYDGTEATMAVIVSPDSDVVQAFLELCRDEYKTLNGASKAASERIFFSMEGDPERPAPAPAPATAPAPLVPW